MTTRCGSDDLDWGAGYEEDGTVFYPYKCNDCSAEGLKIYETIYRETTLNTKEDV